MWGCIDKLIFFSPFCSVPSLYVRVYRLWKKWGLKDLSSLIICEGVSGGILPVSSAYAFPHYMWGCIASCSLQICSNVVPSLYVRVYRRKKKCFVWWICSLIICEGVSTPADQPRTRLSFPHYMWGCIDGWTGIITMKRVPSLYVRVYRKKPGIYTVNRGSLIICEGVSTRNSHDVFRVKFPHYMWGCIVCKPA